VRVFLRTSALRAPTPVYTELQVERSSV
jgi:hypothetical protein